jgi:hypothetical protein
VGAGKNTDLARHGPDLVERSAVEALALFEDGLAGDVFDHRPEDTLDPGGLFIGLVFAEFGKRLFADCLDGVLLLELAADLESFAELFGPLALKCLDKFVRPGIGFGLEFFLDDSELGNDLMLQGDDFLDFLVGEIEGVKDDLLGKLARTALDHCQRIVGAGYNQIELTALELFKGGEDHESSVDPANPDAGNGFGERDLR